MLVDLGMLYESSIPDDNYTQRPGLANSGLVLDCRPPRTCDWGDLPLWCAGGACCRGASFLACFVASCHCPPRQPPPNRHRRPGLSRHVAAAASNRATH